MAGFDNDTIYGNNADFSRAGAGGGSANNGLQLNGQLWIGTTNVNAGGTHVKVGFITSSSGSLTVSNNSGNIDLSVAGGTTTIQTLTGNSGGALSPTAGNINTLGTGSITISGSGSTLTTQLTGLTNHAVLVGAGTATITKVGPTATAGQVFQSSGAAADPAFSTATYPSVATSAGTILRADGTNWLATTATYPNTTTISQLLYSSTNNAVTGLTTANNGLLVTSNTGVPSILAGPGTSGNVLQSNASAAPSFSTATYPSVATGTGTILRADGTNWVATTATYPATTTINQVLYSSSNNVIGGITAANNGTMISGTTGIPSWLANGTTGQLLTATTGSPPSWVSPATSGTVTTVSVVTANGFAGTVANASTTPAITLTTSQTGVLVGNGTSMTGNAITQHDVLVGGASNAITSVAPSSTSGVPLISQGASADPAFGTAVVAGGGTGNTTFTAYSVICAGTTATGVFQNVSGVGTSGQVLTSNGASALPTWQAAGGSGFTVLAGQLFTSSGAFTYTPTANMKYVLVELVGGGGGSGGTNSAVGVGSNSSGGGGSGGYARFILTAAQVGASVTGSVGAGGTAGASGTNTGGTGGSTTLATSSAWTVAGGVGGTGGAAAAAQIAAGGAGGTVTSGTGTVIASITGQTGGTGFGVGTIAYGGLGGNSVYGKGGAAPAVVAISTITQGSAGVGYGGGASGNATLTGGASAGAAGAIGVAIFTEFC